MTNVMTIMNFGRAAFYDIDHTPTDAQPAALRSRHSTDLGLTMLGYYSGVRPRKVAVSRLRHVARIISQKLQVTY